MRLGSLSAAVHQNHYLLGAIVTLILAAGATALNGIPRLEDPRITNRTGYIITELPAASPERIEALINDKLEDALRTVSEIDEIRSTARPGISLIVVLLKDKVTAANNQQVFARIRDELADAESQLPPEASKPVLDDDRELVAWGLLMAVRYTGPTDTEPPMGMMNRFAEELSDRLRRHPDTELVSIYGGVREEITVTPDPKELGLLGISPEQLTELVAAADAKSPSGVLESPARRMLLSVEGEFEELDRIRDIPLPIARTGATSLRLGSVAEVRKDWLRPPENIALTNGRRSVLVGARPVAGKRIDLWSEDAKAIFREFRDRYSGGNLELELIFEQARYTEARLASLTGNLLGGIAVIMLVVTVLMGWRQALAISSTLPLSLAAALFALSGIGEALQQMTIFGLIVAIGLLIDNAIVMTDEIGKRLREGYCDVEAIEASVDYLFVPLLSSTLTTVISFLPIFLMPGNGGDFIDSLGASVIVALISSWFISFAVVPSLAARLWRRYPDKTRGWWQGGFRARGFRVRFQRGLRLALATPWPSLMLVLLLPLAGFLSLSSVGRQFFPGADRGQFQIQVWMPDDTSLSATRSLVQEIDRDLETAAGVLGTTWLIGGSAPKVYYNLLENRDSQTNYAQGFVNLADPKAVESFLSLWQERLDERYPEARVILSKFGQGPPRIAPIELSIYGPNLELLLSYGQHLRRLLSRHPQVTHTYSTLRSGRGELAVRADEDAMRLAGLSMDDLSSRLQASLRGFRGGSLLEQTQELPVRVRFPEEVRASLGSIRDLSLVNGSGQHLPLSSLAEVELVPAMSSITRQDGQRVNTVRAFVREGALPIEVTSEILEELEADLEFSLADGYRLELGGDSESRQDAVDKLLLYLPLLLTIMVAVLVLSTSSLRLTGLLLSVGLFAIGLGMLALGISGYPLGFNPIIGSTSLVGIALNDSIVVLAAIRSNSRAQAGNLAAIARETMGCGRHVLATTLTTAGGFLPLLLFVGGNFWPPLAIVIAGGVLGATVIALMYVPIAYVLLRRLAPLAGERARER